MELTEKTHAAEFILFAANGNRSFDQAVVASGQDVLEAGTILALSGAKYVQWDANESAGLAEAILRDRVDATDADAPCVVVARDCEVNDHSLIYPDDANDGEKANARTDLAANGIIVRTGTVTDLSPA